MAMVVKISSCVIASSISASRRSFSFTRIPSTSSHRPVFFQISAGCTTGSSISWPPMASISWRMMFWTLRATRRPSGSRDHEPAIRRRMKPPRTSNRWFAASASAGSSRRVGMNASDQRMGKG